MDGIEPGQYYLRIYPDGRVAQWPSPPNDETSWTRLSGNTIEYGYNPPLSNPRLGIRDNKLIMSNSDAGVVGRSFTRVIPDIEPSQ